MPHRPMAENSAKSGRTELKQRWAEANGLIEIEKEERAHFVQLLELPALPDDDVTSEFGGVLISGSGLPGDDHVTIWRRPTDKPPAIRVMGQPALLARPGHRPGNAALRQQIRSRILDQHQPGLALSRPRFIRRVASRGSLRLILRRRRSAINRAAIRAAIRAPGARHRFPPRRHRGRAPAPRPARVQPSPRRRQP